MPLFPVQDVMYVFGGALLPSEEVTNELWSLHLSSLTWTLENVMESSGSGIEVDIYLTHIVSVKPVARE